MMPPSGARFDSTRDGPQRSAAGFSLVEVVVAIIILAVGVLGLGGTTAYIVRQVTLADVMSERSAALQSVIERVQAMAFDSVTTGSDSIGVFNVSWSAGTGAQSKVVQIVTMGPGLHTTAGNPFPMLAPAVPDTFEYRLLRP